MLHFGLENGEDCYCGKEYPKFIPTHPSECDTHCSGNSDEICGGSWRLSLHSWDLTTQFEEKNIYDGECVQGRAIKLQKSIKIKCFIFYTYQR